jgi:hypothetical protein
MRYDGIFTSWADVQSNFTTNEPEPDEVIWAAYDCADYEGSALVIYRNGDKYFTNSGGHCSCYGLEEQWEPTETTKEELIAFYTRHIDNKEPSYGPHTYNAKVILENLNGR